jgi:hypothetical protein
LPSFRAADWLQPEVANTILVQDECETLGGSGGGYIFNLSTKGLAPGQYVLSFYVGSERSFFYTVKFEVK